MFSKILDAFVIAILISARKIASSSDDVNYVDIVCSTEHLDPKFIHAAMTVLSSRSIIANVIFTNNSKFDTSKFDKLIIKSENESVRFLPAGIKKTFPKLVGLYSYECGLTHLERNDMRQFGDDITYANFGRNLLTALEDNLFEYNSNLIDIFFSFNPFKYINAELFLNLKQIKKIRIVEFNYSGCINQLTESFSKNFTFNSMNCSDEEAKKNNLRIISERETFFMRKCLDVYCTSINETSDGPEDESFNCSRGCVMENCRGKRDALDNEMKIFVQNLS